MRLSAALADLRAGRPVLVADSADREDEVDVVLAAEHASPEWLGWMIQHTSGYVCAPLPVERAVALELPLMVADSQDSRRTAYTVSVDAASGVTTGISAADRARTLRVLADPTSGPGDLIRPGHVLPLRAVAGGVAQRAGHTEAGVELCRLAGLQPVAAIAELVNSDGSMMRLAQAGALAERHRLSLITIAELEAGLSSATPPSLAPEEPAPGQARVVREGAAVVLPTEWGDFELRGYQDLGTGAVHVALLCGAGLSATPPVRVHSECLTGDGLGSLRCDCGPQLRAGLAIAAAEGGLVIYLGGHEGRGIGLLGKLAAYALQDDGRDTVQANLELGYPVDGREYGAAAAILHDLGVDSLRLLTNNPDKVLGLRAGGIEVVSVEPLESGANRHNLGYLRAKRDQLGHSLRLAEGGR
ncbi:MAG: 3,4-dihydroxy-2-butanone-4-phosphate synthase [Actinobacteria bacterium]|nr:3,4-dihydroxy-2-butanone-4-phosphate synthase [Actinomycetota bacterium]